MNLLLAKGDRAGAKKTLEGAISVDANLIAARLSLIQMLTEDKELDAARIQPEQTRKVAPRDLRVNYYDAVLAFRSGELDRARQQLQQLLKFLPDHPNNPRNSSPRTQRGRPRSGIQRHRAKAAAP